MATMPLGSAVFFAAWDHRCRTHAVRLGLLLAVCCACTTESSKDDAAAVVPVSDVDLSRYVGTWYEIARFDERFQRGCFASQAHYAPGDHDEIEVVNSCRQGGFDGRWRSVRGRAQVQPDSQNARLKVNFFGPFWGDYWVLERDADYAFAAVGDPRRRHLWILSRTPQMDPGIYQALVSRLAKKGFAVERLVPTPQPNHLRYYQDIDPAQLWHDVKTIAQAPRPRGSFHHQATRQLILERLHSLGYTDLAGHALVTPAITASSQTPAGEGRVCLDNIVAMRPGHTYPQQHVMLSAHYDSVPNSPGADDNASGVAGVLAVAAALAQKPQARTTLIALWDGEEEGLLGSALWAAMARRRQIDLRHVWVLEMIGYRNGARNSQKLPPLVALTFPWNSFQVWREGMRGNFIAIIGDDPASRSQLADAGVGVSLKVRGFAVPTWARSSAAWTDLGRSDHASFWRAGYSASFVTDTANFRNAAYHSPADRLHLLDPDWLHQVVRAVAQATQAQLNPPP